MAHPGLSAAVPLAARLLGTFAGIRAVQAFRREHRNEEIFASLNGRRAAASLRSSRLIAVYSPGITPVANLATGAVLLYGGLRVIGGDMKLGILPAFLLYLGRFFDPLQELSQFCNSFQWTAPTCARSPTPRCAARRCW